MNASILALLMLVPIATPQEKELAGAWHVDSLEEDAVKANPEYWRTIRFVFKGDRLVFEGDDVLRMKATSIKLVMHDGMPRGLDLEITEGSEKGTTMEGIYEIKGDELRICLRVDGAKNRPLEFTTKSGSNRALFTLKRGKP